MAYESYIIVSVIEIGSARGVPDSSFTEINKQLSLALGGVASIRSRRRAGHARQLGTDDLGRQVT